MQTRESRNFGKGDTIWAQLPSASDGHASPGCSRPYVIVSHAVAKPSKLEAAEDYKILSQGVYITLDRVDDAVQFRAVKKALGTIGIEPDRQIQVRELRYVTGRSW